MEYWDEKVQQSSVQVHKNKYKLFYIQKKIISHNGHVSKHARDIDYGEKSV